MRYCTRCVTPSTRPAVVIADDGVCSACRSHDTKQAIDWAARCPGAKYGSMEVRPVMEFEGIESR